MLECGTVENTNVENPQFKVAHLNQGMMCNIDHDGEMPKYSSSSSFHHSVGENPILLKQDYLISEK